MSTVKLRQQIMPPPSPAKPGLLPDGAHAQRELSDFPEVTEEEVVRETYACSHEPFSGFDASGSVHWLPTPPRSGVVRGRGASTGSSAAPSASCSASSGGVTAFSDKPILR